MSTALDSAHTRPAASPWRETLAIAGPTVATMTSYTLMTFTDKWLVSMIGPEPIYVGAQGNGGLAAWVPMSILHGTLTIINTFVSQNMGAGRPERGPAYAWNGLWLGLLFWAVFLFPFSFTLPAIFDAAKMDPAQARLATQYGQILLWGSFITMVTRSMSQFFYGMHKAKVVMVAGVAANIFNLGISYVLTFGLFGLPKLGVAGSAIGTVIATLVEAAIPMGVFLGRAMNTKYRTRAAWRPSLPVVRDIVRLGWPGGIMFGNEMACWSIFMVYLVSHFGREHATAGWIAHQYMSLSFMPAVGLSVACTALVGKYQGMGRSDLAQHRAFLCLRASVIYMGICGVLFLVFREELIRFFVPGTTDPEAVERLVEIGSGFLMATAAFQLFDAGAMIISGALRGAGDTVFPGVFTVIASWVLIVGGGFAFVEFAPSLGSLGPWIAAAGYITVLCIALLARFLSGRWKSIKVVHDTPSGPGAADRTPTPEPAAAAGATTDGIV
ncbi:MAG: MATE family efflux transporter [Planctomycetota bacterium]|nr:MATE family efflux transporter [Planctomycetota bacterium]